MIRSPYEPPKVNPTFKQKLFGLIDLPSAVPARGQPPRPIKTPVVSGLFTKHLLEIR